MLALLFLDLGIAVHSTLIQITNDTKLGDIMSTQRKQTDNEKRSRAK
jgi:hypothetical protein